MNEYIQAIKSAKKKKLLWGEKNLYEPGISLNDSDLDELEKRYNFSFPLSIKQFLLGLGCGSINDLNIPHVDGIYPFDKENGIIEGYIAIATDILGNYIAFNPNGDDSEVIYYCSHDPVGFGLCSKNIITLTKDFVESGFDIMQVTDNVDLQEI